MDITREQLKAIMPNASWANIDKYLPHLNAAMAEFEINTSRRQAAFLAQVGHESASLYYVRELADGSAYDTGKLAKQLGNTPEDDNDGEWTKGRGLGQMTGMANYEAYRDYCGKDCIFDPGILEEPEDAARSAGFMWNRLHLNQPADENDFERIVRIYNGGHNGWADRVAYWDRARKALGAL